MNVLKINSSLFNKTPLLRHTFKKNSGPKILLKYEFLQPSGSFKSRGIGHLISKRVEELYKRKPGIQGHVFASSGGNAGLAAAVASSELQIPCTVVVSKATRPRLVEKIKSYGARVIVYGRHWKEADTYMRENLMKQVNTETHEPIYTHPFDNPLIWEGHSYMVDEILNSLKNLNISADEVKGIVCSFGGGGLYNGIIKGLEKHNLAEQVPVVCAETKGTDVLRASLIADKLVEFAEIKSCATSLGTANISSVAFENVKKYSSKSAVVSDKDVIETCLQFSKDTNIVTEPGCGATLYFGYNPHRLQEILGTQFKEDDYVILIGCGGSSTNLKELQELSRSYNIHLPLPQTQPNDVLYGS